MEALGDPDPTVRHAAANALGSIGLAKCRMETGDAAGALVEAEDLLSLAMETRGARHPDVLATRFLLARCLMETGDKVGASAEVEDLLPLRIEVEGARHPRVLPDLSWRSAVIELDPTGDPPESESIHEACRANEREVTTPRAMHGRVPLPDASHRIIRSISSSVMASSVRS
jgi:hypothetical protein